MSKLEEIVSYIKKLGAGEKISVRSIASDLGVSEGTAYKAIKECETLGIVSTIPRVGTVRVESVEDRHSEALTFAHVVNIINGSILGGKDGIYKTLNKFAIGAMTVDAVKNYITPGTMVIVGNREEIQRYALEHDAGVLISGGFSCSQEIQALADEKKLPIISSSYDTFTIATIINKAIWENKLKKDIVLVEDVMGKDPNYLKVDHTLEDWKALVGKTKHIRYPVVDKDMKVVGVITAKDLPLSMDGNQLIGKVMNKNPITVTPKTAVSYASYIMGGEDIELCPVVDGRKLVGVLTKKDVIKALQHMDKEIDIVQNMEDSLLKSFVSTSNGDSVHYEGAIPAKMLDSMGTVCWSSLNMLFTAVAVDTLNKVQRNISVDSVSTFFMKPLQIDTNILINSKILELGRNYCKVEVEMYNNKKELVGKSLLSAKVLKTKV